MDSFAQQARRLALAFAVTPTVAVFAMGAIYSAPRASAQETQCNAGYQMNTGNPDMLSHIGWLFSSGWAQGRASRPPATKVIPRGARTVPTVKASRRVITLASSLRRTAISGSGLHVGAGTR